MPVKGVGRFGNEVRVAAHVSGLPEEFLQIFLRRGNGRDAEFLHKQLKDIGGKECRECGSKQNVLNSKMQKGQQDADSLLLIPGQHHGKGEGI